MTTLTSTSELRIYVACLASYNTGYLHGRWIDVSDPETMQDEIDAILKTAPVEDAEEWAIHDYDGFERGIVNEYSSLQEVCEIAEFIEDNGSWAGELLSYFGGDLGDAKNCAENYAGTYTSLEDYAREMTEGNIPEHLENYIDFERMGKDYAQDMIEIWTHHDEVSLFYNC